MDNRLNPAPATGNAAIGASAGCQQNAGHLGSNIGGVASPKQTIEELRQSVGIWRARAECHAKRSEELERSTREWQALATDACDDLAIKRAEFEIALADVRSARDGYAARAGEYSKQLSIAKRMIAIFTGILPEFTSNELDRVAKAHADRAAPLTPAGQAKIDELRREAEARDTENAALRHNACELEHSLAEAKATAKRGEDRAKNAEAKIASIIAERDHQIKSISEAKDDLERSLSWSSAWTDELRNHLRSLGVLTGLIIPKGPGYRAHVEFSPTTGNRNSTLTGNSEASKLETPRRQTPWAHKAGSLAEMVREAIYTPWSAHQSRRIGELLHEIETETTAHCRRYFEENWK